MNSNIITQLVSVVLWIFALAGLQINPDATANDAVVSVQTANWPLFLMLLINIGNSIWQWSLTWKTNKPNFILFLRSHNWWASVLNVVFAIALLNGIVLPADAAHRVVEYAFSGDWWGLAGYALPAIIAPIVTFLTKKKADALKAKAGVKAT